MAERSDAEQEDLVQNFPNLTSTLLRYEAITEKKRLDINQYFHTQFVFINKAKMS